MTERWSAMLAAEKAPSDFQAPEELSARWVRLPLRGACTHNDAFNRLPQCRADKNMTSLWALHATTEYALPRILRDGYVRANPELIQEGYGRSCCAVGFEAEVMGTVTNPHNEWHLRRLLDKLTPRGGKHQCAFVIEMRAQGEGKVCHRCSEWSVDDGDDRRLVHWPNEARKMWSIPEGETSQVTAVWYDREWPDP